MPDDPGSGWEAMPTSYRLGQVGCVILEIGGVANAAVGVATGQLAIAGFGVFVAIVGLLVAVALRVRWRRITRADGSSDRAAPRPGVDEDVMRCESCGETRCVPFGQYPEACPVCGSEEFFVDPELSWPDAPPQSVQ